MNESEDVPAADEDRNLSVRGIIPALHHVRDSESDLLRIGSLISRFACDPEPSVRAELAEQLPPIACFCLNSANRVPDSIYNITLAILEQLLTDGNSQVRRITQNSLAFMLEKRLVDFTFVEEKISPVLVHLMDITSVDDYRIEAITTVSKIVRFLGKSVTEKVFLQHFSRLCSDLSFHVRRACASNFGEICSVIGQDLTEAVLLPQFKSLCEDGIWGVRKACADVFVPVSCVCSNETRQNVLTPLFVSLLCDQSKWVKMAAFQSLGPFISTFADPAKTGLYYTDGGLIVLEDGKDQESNSSGSTDSGCSTDSHHSSDETFCVESSSSSATQTTSSSTLLPSYVHSLSLNETKSPATTTSTSSSNVVIAWSQVAAAVVTSIPVHLSYAKHVVPHSRRRGSHEEESFFRSNFSAFQFWRIPITDPSFDPEISCVDVGAAALLVASPVRTAPAGDEAEEGMVIDPPPHPPQEDDCEKRLEAYYNSHGDDQEDGAEQNTKGRGGREEEPNQKQLRRQPEDQDEEAGGQIRPQQQHECEDRQQGRDGTGESASRPDLSSGPADEAEMREDEIEDDASQCISFPGNHHQQDSRSIISGSANQESVAASNAAPDHQDRDEPPPSYMETKEAAAAVTADGVSAPDEPESMDQEECENEIVTVRNTVQEEPAVVVVHDCDTVVKSSDMTEQTTPEMNSNCSKRPFLTFFNTTDQQQQQAGELQQGMGEESSALSSVMSGANYQRILNQESIPSDLLKHFLSMTSPVNYETVDHELSHYCAYSFPAVAMTLGRKHWPCLMATYESLAADVQWKVRLTLASSLHQMAVILGPKYTSRDLMPIFFQFMTDLDEVRFGILQNLSCIMRLLNRSEQLSILPRIMDFLRMDNPRNWRFRRTLADQVVTIAPLFSPTEIKEHLLPIAYTLLKDKVSDVRLSAIHLLSTLMHHFFCDTSLPLRHTPPPPFPTLDPLSPSSASSTASHQPHACYRNDNNSSNINNNNNNNNCPNGSPNQTSGTMTHSNTTTQSMDRQHTCSTTSTSITKTPAAKTPSTTTAAATKSNARLPLDQVSLELISELTALVRSPKWVFRQAFVFLCEQMITDQSLPVQVFNDHFFDCLMSLKGDRVSNVRLALSRCMQRSIHGNVMFHEKQESVITLLMEFTKDPDSDVRRFARLVIDPYPTAVNAAYLEMMAEYESLSSATNTGTSCDDQQQQQQVRNQDADDVFLSGSSSISSGHLNSGPGSDNSSWLSSARISLIPQPRDPAPTYTQPPPPPFPMNRISETSSVAQVLQPEVESVIEAEPEVATKDDQESSSIIQLNRPVDLQNIRMTIDSTRVSAANDGISSPQDFYNRRKRRDS